LHNTYFNFTKVLNINQFSWADAGEFFAHQFIFNFAPGAVS
jgi:hypothetical protein